MSFSLQRLARKAFYLWLLLLPVEVTLGATYPEYGLPLRGFTSLLFLLVLSPLLYNWFRGRTAEDDQALFLGELSRLMAKELPLDQALKKLWETRRKQLDFRFAAFTPVLGELARRVAQGSGLSHAMRDLPEIPRAWIDMIEEAEVRDEVPEVLATLASIEKTRLRLPALTVIRTQFLVVFLLGISLFLSTYILPTFLELFRGSELQPNWTTQLLSRVGNKGLLQVVLLPLGLLATLVVLAVPFPRVHHGLRAMLFYLPGFRATLKAEQQSRAVASMAAATRLGMPLGSVVEAGRSALTIGAYRKALVYKEGSTLSFLFEQNPTLWDPSLIWICRQGEAFDRLPEALAAAIEGLERQYRLLCQKLVVALDTGVLLAVGIAVALMCIGCTMPYYQFVDAVLNGVLP